MSGKSNLATKVTRATHLFGVRTWASWSEFMKPHFILYVYLGLDEHAGIHYFHRRGTQQIIGKTTEQITAGINKGSFKPFCINMEVEDGV